MGSGLTPYTIYIYSAGRRVLFDPRRGGVVCTPCGGGPIELSKGAAGALSDLARAGLEEAASTGLGADGFAEIRNALDEFLAHHLDRPLRSAAFFRRACS